MELHEIIRKSSTYAWPREKLEVIVKLYNQGEPSREIAAQSGYNRRQLRSKLCRMHKAGLPYVRKKYIAKQDLYIPTNLELFDEPELRAERKKLLRVFSGGAKKIVNLCDLHIPFHDGDILKKALEEKADICTMPGDILDLYFASKFAKSKMIPLKREIDEGMYIIDIIADNYPYVVIGKANHEARILKILQNRLMDYPELVERLKGYTNVMQEVTRDFKNIILVNDWWFRIGLTVFAHPDWYLSLGGKTAQGTHDYFIKENEPFDCLINAHVHRFHDEIYRRKRLIESPCLALKGDYIRAGRRRYTGEWHEGYVVIEQDKFGHIIQNKTRVHFLGWG